MFRLCFCCWGAFVDSESFANPLVFEKVELHAAKFSADWVFGVVATCTEHNVTSEEIARVIFLIS